MRPGRPEDLIPRYGPQGDYVAIYIRKLHVTWDEFQTTIGERVGELWEAGPPVAKRVRELRELEHHGRAISSVRTEAAAKANAARRSEAERGRAHQQAADEREPAQ